MPTNTLTKKKAGDGTPKAGYVSNLRVRGSMEKTFISPETLMMDLWLDAYEPQSSREESWMAKWKGWLVGWWVGFPTGLVVLWKKLQYFFFFRKKIGIVELKFLFFCLSIVLVSLAFGREIFGICKKPRFIGFW